MFPVSEERLSQRKAITDAEIQREAITKDVVFDVVRRNLIVTVTSKYKSYWMDIVLVFSHLCVYGKITAYTPVIRAH